MRRLFKPLWQTGFLSQVSALVFLALVAAMGVTIWLFSNSGGDAIVSHWRAEHLRKVSAVTTIFKDTSPDFRGELVRSLERLGTKISLNDAPALPLPQSREEQQLADDLLARLPEELQRAPLHLLARDVTGEVDIYQPQKNLQWLPRPPWLPRMQELEVDIPIGPGAWLHIVSQSPAPPVVLKGPPIVFALVAFGLVMAVLVILLRNITRPLVELARAADRIGHGTRVAEVRESGPADIRSAIRAFNAMNNRIEQFVAERTRMLAALSHDLRTPITSMRLRLELMEQTAEVKALLSSLNEIQQMSEMTLVYVRESRDAESLQTVDLAALLASICDDYTDLGKSVTFEYDQPTLFTCRPLSLKRAIRNIVENATGYGQRAWISIERGTNHLAIIVEDDGPGIDPTLGEKAFEPYTRGETSRSRNTGGIGLGLSITRQIINNHGGTVHLKNTGSGLKVTLELPLM